MFVNKDVRDVIIVAVSAVAIVALMFSSLYVYSGQWSSFSVVESGSMQHGEKSTLHTIDTGDMVVIRDPSKVEIVSYVEGYTTGYKKFGEYGDVIIYKRLNQGNPIIHRAILWLDWDGEKWSAPSLAEYNASDGTPLWKDSSDSDWQNLNGTLILKNIGYSSKDVKIILTGPEGLIEKSGYLTLGDNGKTNTDFDQNTAISKKTLVSNDRIMYVAGFEIPWIGCLKLLATGKNVDQIPPNSIPSLICTVIAIMCAFATMFVISDYITWYRRR